MSKGWADTRYTRVSNTIFTFRDDIYYPDSHYVRADTVSFSDTSSHLSREDQLSYNTMIGVGSTIQGDKNEIILAGLKFSYLHHEFNSVQDSLYRHYQTYHASISIGTEWYLFKFFCPRCGLNLYYEHINNNLRDGGDKYDYTDSSLGLVSAFGFGLKAGSHFQLDFHTNNAIFDFFGSWAFDMTYNF